MSYAPTTVPTATPPYVPRQQQDDYDNKLLRMNYAVNREQPNYAVSREQPRSNSSSNNNNTSSSSSFGLPYLQVNFMIMSNNKVGLGGNKLGAAVDGNKVGAAFDGNKVGADMKGNKVGADFKGNEVGAKGNKVGAALDGNKVGARADLEGNKVGASAMDKVDLDGETEVGSQGQLEDGTGRHAKNEKSGDSSGNKLIDWKIDFDAAGGALTDKKEETDHYEDEHKEATDRTNYGTVNNRPNRDYGAYNDPPEGEISYNSEKGSGRVQSVLTFPHDANGTVWPRGTYNTLRKSGMGRILALVAMFVIHFSLSYRTMGSWIPDPRLPVKFNKKRVS